jgi:hypothetical protein
MIILMIGSCPAHQLLLLTQLSVEPSSETCMDHLMLPYLVLLVTLELSWKGVLNCGFPLLSYHSLIQSMPQQPLTGPKEQTGRVEKTGGVE